MAPTERARRAEALHTLVTRRKPGDWLADQLAAVDPDLGAWHPPRQAAWRARPGAQQVARSVGTGPGPRRARETTTSAAATSSGGVSSSATATRTVRVPLASRGGRERRRRPGRRRRHRRSTPRSCPGPRARPPTPCRCRPGAGTPRPSDPGWQHEPGALRTSVRAKSEARTTGVGGLAPVHGHRDVLVLDPHAVAGERRPGRPRPPRPPRRARARPPGPGAPRRPRPTRARRRRRTAPPGPAAARRWARNDTGRPETTATTAKCWARAASTPGASGSGVGGAGSATMGARVPSKSVSTALDPGSSSRTASGPRGSPAPPRLSWPGLPRRRISWHGRVAPRQLVAAPEVVVDPGASRTRSGPATTTTLAPAVARHRGHRGRGLDGAGRSTRARRSTRGGRAGRPRHRVDLGAGHLRASSWWRPG